MLHSTTYEQARNVEVKGSTVPLQFQLSKYERARKLNSAHLNKTFAITLVISTLIGTISGYAWINLQAIVMPFVTQALVALSGAVLGASAGLLLWGLHDVAMGSLEDNEEFEFD